MEFNRVYQNRKLWKGSDPLHLVLIYGVWVNISNQTFNTLKLPHGIHTVIGTTSNPKLAHDIYSTQIL